MHGNTQMFGKESLLKLRSEQRQNTTYTKNTFAWLSKSDRSLFLGESFPNFCVFVPVHAIGLLQNGTSLRSSGPRPDSLVWNMHTSSLLQVVL